MILPLRVLSLEFTPPRAVLACQRGRIELTFHAAGIVHFAYFPDDKACRLPMWGILASPDKALEVSRRAGKDRLVFKAKGIAVEVDKATAQVRFLDGKGRVLIASRSYGLQEATVSGEATYHVRAEFGAPERERYYGLGQHQVGWMDHRGQEVRVWHDYQAAGGEIIGVPFMVALRDGVKARAGEGNTDSTDKKRFHGTDESKERCNPPSIREIRDPNPLVYGVIMDNPSRVTVRPGVGGTTTWEAEAGPALSFFVIAGDTADDIYAGYRLLTGATPLPPKGALGYIQCKQRYASRDELVAVAREHRRRGYPGDALVVDWFHWRTLGDMDLDEKFWPDAKAMNDELARLGFQVMISCWPRFMKESRHFAALEGHGWFMKQSDGRTLYGTPEDQRGAVIDTTNQDAGRWFWDRIRDSYAAKGFASWWLDEDEPDICPHAYFLHGGTGAAVHNIYPLTHTQAVYEGHRRDLKSRCLILSRSAYLGAQRNGTTFWSSDIYPEWHVLRRQIPAGLNFCATGFPYWSSDIGGWQALADRRDKSKPKRPPLIEPDAEARKVVGDYDDYVELYVRWFQFGAFCPTFRAHGTRDANEIWSYGRRAEEILARYLRLRYRLMPYIYSLAARAWRTGAPFMRAMFMDFPGDPKVGDIKDQYMFGPAFLVAPVVEQGATSRQVYLPAGADWYDYWTSRKFAGGQTITADAPVETLPLFVRAGSIIPHVAEAGSKIDLWIYRGADGRFELYDDDGRTYDYEHGKFSLIDIRWHDKGRRISIKDNANSYGRAAQDMVSRIRVVADGGHSPL